MSPKRGRKAPGRRGDPSASRRLALLLFGVAFVALFAIVAIGEGVGDPDIPSGDIIYVEEIPGGGGEISQADFDNALRFAALQSGQKKAPKPGSKQYDEMKEAALTSLLEFAWVEGEAAERGITVTQQEIDKEREKIKEENFQSEAEFQEFLKESGFTPKDIDERVKFQIFSTEIQKELPQEPKPSQSEIENYYEAAKATQFTQPASRDVRLIRNKDREKAAKALATLEEGNTAKDWNRVAKELSEDAATKNKGGLQQNVAEGTLEEPLGADVFESPEGQLEGPVEAGQGYYVFEVQSSTPEEVQDLKSVESQIESQLTQRTEQEEFNAFASDFNIRWMSRTFCAPDYVVENCANYEDDGRPESAPPACYEEDPQGGEPPACPAPVFQAVPALPGSVTPLALQGNPLAQRPHPAGEGAPAGEEAPTGLPEGVPPTGE